MSHEMERFSLLFGGTSNREDSISSMINIVTNADGSGCFRAGLAFQQLIYLGEQGEVIVTKHCNCPGVTTGDYIIVSDNVKVSQMVFNSMFQFLMWASSNKDQVGVVINLLQGYDSCGPIPNMFKYSGIRTTFTPEESQGLYSSLYSGIVLENLVSSLEDVSNVFVPSTVLVPKNSKPTIKVVDYLLDYLGFSECSDEITLLVQPVVKYKTQSIKVVLRPSDIIGKEELANSIAEVSDAGCGASVRAWIYGDEITVFSMCGKFGKDERRFFPVACYGNDVDSDSNLRTTLNKVTGSIAPLVASVNLVSTTFIKSDDSIYLLDVDGSPSLAADTQAYDCITSTLNAPSSEHSPIITYLSYIVNLA